MIKLSIIVPFYNVESYIENCVRSLYNQDIPIDEYEVICVDDCSLDSSRSIIENLQKEYQSLKLVCHERNKKLGAARNTGLKVARGKYIWFVDSDDFIYPNILSSLMNYVLTNNLDILQFDHHRELLSLNKQPQESDVTNGEMFLFDKTVMNWYDKVCGAWKQWFKRSFIIENNLQFIEESLYEDTDYLLLAFLSAQRVQYVSIVAYHYRINLESITLSQMSPVKIAWRINQIIRCSQLISHATTLEAQENIKILVTSNLSQLRSELKKFSYKEKRVYLKNLTSDVIMCKNLISWRTWLAIRYCIVCFI